MSRQNNDIDNSEKAKIDQSNTSQLQDADSEKTAEQQPLQIQLVKHRRLFELLEKPRLLWRVIGMSVFVLVALFAGLAGVVLALKSFYPYSSIETNSYGATIMQTEDKEVIYWLFNTAELWANSGVEVKKNDRLTIRSSGASNTAIHKLVNCAIDNQEPSYLWVGTGGLDSDNSSTNYRDMSRIVSDREYGLLLMQVIPDEYSRKSVQWLKSSDRERQRFFSGSNKNVYIIGGAREDLLISEDGIMHFAVNDIVMTDSILDDIYNQNLDALVSVLKTKVSGSKLERLVRNIKQTFADIKVKEDTAKVEKLKAYNDSLFARVYSDPALIKPFISRNDTITYKQVKEIKYQFGYYFDDGKGQINVSGYPLINELVYYKLHKFRDPWYADNVGSYLIVIERNRSKK